MALPFDPFASFNARYGSFAAPSAADQTATLASRDNDRIARIEAENRDLKVKLAAITAEDR